MHTGLILLQYKVNARFLMGETCFNAKIDEP